MCGAVLNIVGLSLDIFGVVLLFFFGLPPGVNPDGAETLTRIKIDKGQIKKGRMYLALSWFALVLLVLGFLFQIAANFLPPGA